MVRTHLWNQSKKTGEKAVELEAVAPLVMKKKPVMTRGELNVLENIYSAGIAAGTPSIRRACLDFGLGLDAAHELEKASITSPSKLTESNIRIFQSKLKVKHGGEGRGDDFFSADIYLVMRVGLRVLSVKFSRPFDPFFLSFFHIGVECLVFDFFSGLISVFVCTSFLFTLLHLFCPVSSRRFFFPLENSFGEFFDLALPGGAFIYIYILTFAGSLPVGSINVRQSVGHSIRPLLNQYVSILV